MPCSLRRHREAIAFVEKHTGQKWDWTHYFECAKRVNDATRNRLAWLEMNSTPYPQFVGAPGVLEPSATAVEATDKIQFVSALLIAIPAGVGFDTVCTRMQKQMEDQPISPPGQK